MENRHIDERLLSEIVRAAPGLHGAGTLSPKAIRAMAGHLRNRPIQHSLETGAGASTLLFSHLSGDHTVFSLSDGIDAVRGSPLFDSARTRFIEGPTQKTLVGHRFSDKIQAALLDGPHAFPFPHLEYFSVYPSLDTRALFVLDDVHIPGVHDLFRFLRADEMFDFVEIVHKTAFFIRTAAPTFDPFEDGWWLQRYNRKTLLRHSWKDRIKASIRQIQKRVTAPPIAVEWQVTVSEPAQRARVGSHCVVRGSARIPPGTRLWLLARRADQPGWWPQGKDAIDTASNEWSQPCKLGSASDVGFPFELALLVTDETNGSALHDWVSQANTGRAPAPIPLPPPVSGCPPVIVTVRKTIHKANPAR